MLYSLPSLLIRIKFTDAYIFRWIHSTYIALLKTRTVQHKHDFTGGSKKDARQVINMDCGTCCQLACILRRLGMPCYQKIISPNCSQCLESTRCALCVCVCVCVCVCGFPSLSKLNKVIHYCQLQHWLANTTNVLIPFPYLIKLRPEKSVTIRYIWQKGHLIQLVYVFVKV